MNDSLQLWSSVRSVSRSSSTSKASAFKREKSSVSDVRPLAVTKQEHACSEPDALETTQQHKQGQDLSTIPEPVPRPNVHGRVWFLFSRRGKSLKLALTHKLRHQNRGLLKVQWKV